MQLGLWQHVEARKTDLIWRSPSSIWRLRLRGRGRHRRDSSSTSRYPIGSHVVGAFSMPCGNCFFCSMGEDELCDDFSAYNQAKGTFFDGETRLFLRGSEMLIKCVVMGL
ncbi:uncharacterized protein LOC126732716 isoform X3 [Quercus robur]|uniref:uncharacterized protein LOC126732716 isoform X3 n=1 Tax=Quercus robur TaxID=38942 RepID=UPI0021611F2A|nr:uncharacterized protein LOC126732716 isoform X3 [Quercus robur]